LLIFIQFIGLLSKIDINEKRFIAEDFLNIKTCKDAHDFLVTYKETIEDSWLWMEAEARYNIYSQKKKEMLIRFVEIENVINWEVCLYILKQCTSAMQSVLIFSDRRRDLEILGGKIKTDKECLQGRKVLFYLGSLSDQEKKIIKKKLNTNDGKDYIVLINFKAGGQSIQLRKAQVVIHLVEHYNPQLHRQADGRILRFDRDIFWVNIMKRFYYSQVWHVYIPEVTDRRVTYQKAKLLTQAKVYKQLCDTQEKTIINQYCIPGDTLWYFRYTTEKKLQKCVARPYLLVKKWPYQDSDPPNPAVQHIPHPHSVRYPLYLKKNQNLLLQLAKASSLTGKSSKIWDIPGD